MQRVPSYFATKLLFFFLSADENSFQTNNSDSLEPNKCHSLVWLQQRHKKIFLFEASEQNKPRCVDGNFVYPATYYAGCYECAEALVPNLFFPSQNRTDANAYCMG